MIKYKDLMGKTFGRLKVVEKKGPAKNRVMQWLCKCSCGNILIVRSNHLIHGHTRSCGCLQKEKVTDVFIPDLIGKKFGRLTVLSLSKKRKNRAAVWRCKCNCGNYTEVITSCLIIGHTKSCGCLQTESCSGDNNFNWKGGTSKGIYCRDWTNDLKDCVKERDEYKCLNPDCWGKDKTLSVHHINYNKKSCGLENLITVCRSCNTRANTDREWHEAWYKAILYRRYGYI